LGYNPTLFVGFVTSGETVRNALRDRTDPFFAALGRSVLLIARDGTLIEGLDYNVAQSPETADFILLGSNTAPEQMLDSHHAPILARALARDLPMICANPDRVGVTARGLVEGPGVLAAHYQKLGGRVRYIGKPFPEVYDSVRALLGDVSPERILAVGDSLEHDIAGGKRAGCLTVLIEGGIHAEAIAEESGLKRLCAHYGVTPDFTIPRLDW
jgi:HAD superfamily hydrolase (TIGR01459 family)